MNAYPDNGEMKWYYQAVPGDSWDYDAVAQLTLADISVGGAPRRVIMQANKNGYFYVIDRLTGEFITATPYAPMKWSEAMDKKTGRPFSRLRGQRGRGQVRQEAELAEPQMPEPRPLRSTRRPYRHD